MTKASSVNGITNFDNQRLSSNKEPTNESRCAIDKAASKYQ